MQIECSPCCELEETDAYLAGFGVGPDQQLYLLECLGPRDDSWINRRCESDWRVRSVDPDGSQWDLTICGQIRNFNLIQPMPGGFLLAGSRCEFAGDATVPNGYFFGQGGELVRTVLLGDGIQKIHSTATGDTWVSYFDEGIFGHLGWSRPIGSHGLLRFDSKGSRAYGFEPTSGLDAIVDCYAMNVATSRDVWCYYYTQFSIVQIQDDRVVHHWTCPVSGASELTVWRDQVAIPSGYAASSWTVLRLMPNGRAEPIEELEFLDELGAALAPSAATCRGDAIWFVCNRKVYRTILRDLRI